jgi:hypothetical protein
MTQTTGFAEALIALGQHMQQNQNQNLSVSNVSWSFWVDQSSQYVDGLDIHTRDGADGLTAWASTLTDVSSHVRRNGDGTLFGFVRGRMAAVPVCTWASFPDGDAFSSEPGVHEWDVTVLLREA